MEMLKKKKKNQESIFSDLLRKRNCKYIRVAGNNILEKYNNICEAKMMLNGSCLKPKQKQVDMIAERVEGEDIVSN